MFPALRLGYVVVPKDLVPAFSAARDAADIFSLTLYQAVLTDFIREGHFARHTLRMRMLYMDRRRALVNAIQTQIGDMTEVIGAEAGMHLVALLAPGTDDVAVSRKADQRGISDSGRVRRDTPGITLGNTGDDTATRRTRFTSRAAALSAQVSRTNRYLANRFAKPEEKSLLYSPYRILASLVTIRRVAGHLNFDIPSFLDHALTACRAKTGAFVGPPGTTVALDDVETDLCRADFGGPGLDRRHQRMRCASTPEIRVHPHCHQVNYGEVMWIAAAGHEPARFATCFKKERHTVSQPPPPILRRPGQLPLIG
jgi:hypothetical protein